MSDDVPQVYPGTSTPLRDEVEAQPPADEVEPSWIKRGKVYLHGGHERVFYPIGALADALGVQSTTIHKWERMGWLPKPKLRGKVQGNMGGRRRLYTREQIETLVKIAQEEGLLDNPNVPKKKTRFPERARAAMEALS